MPWLGEFGAGLLQILALFALIGVSAATAAKIVDKFWPNVSENRGCLLMCVLVAAFVAAGLVVFGPALDVLQRYSCRSAANFEDCMDPPERPDPM